MLLPQTGVPPPWHVVFEHVGASTWEKSVACLPYGGRLVIEHAPSAVPLPAPEALPEALAELQRATKVAFDPEGMLRPAPLPGGAT